MGCWNETCALTRLPIRAGMPIVGLTTVYGPRYKSTDSSALATDLLFGLPFEGTYDDYGGVEALTNPQLAALHEKAFETAGYFKQWQFKRDYGGTDSWWLAAHADSLWSLTDKIKPIYYRELGLKLSEIDSHAESARAKSLDAYKRTEEALAQLGDRLGAAVFSEKLPEAQDQLFAIFEEVFGAERAWGAWNAIRHEGLFASRATLLMHQSAYAAVVKEFGERKVGYHQDKTRYKLRDFIAQQLDSWLDYFPTEYAKWECLFGESDANLPALEQRKRVLRYASSGRSYSHLRPLTHLWMAPEVPLVGHFWGGAMPEEILSVVSKEVLIDYFVFQWARFYLRIDFTKPQGGSQNQEVVLPEKIFKATLAMLKKNNFAKKDFDGTLFR